jgi:hypothetical protein
MPQPQDPGIGVGPGGLIASLLNPGLATRVAQHITPNPNPLAQQGQGPQPGAVDSLGNPVGGQPPPGANLAPPAVTQPDPINSAYAADLMRYQRVQANSDSLNYYLQGIASDFGTAEQQRAKKAALGAAPGTVGGGLGDLMNIQKMQDQTIQDNEHARFMANAQVFAQTLSTSLGRPVSVAEATEIMNNKPLMEQFGGAAAAGVTPTGEQKNFGAAQAAVTKQVQTEHPDWTPAQVQKEVNLRVPPSLLMSGVGNLTDQEYFQYAAAERAAGRTPMGPVEWNEQQKNKAIAQETTTKQATEFKDTAIQDYDSVNSKLRGMQQYIDTLKKDPLAAKAALAAFSPTTGKWGAINPLVGDNVKAAAIALQKIQAELKSEQLSGVKNVRNLNEFNTLGQAATGGLDAAASDDDFKTAVDNLTNRYLDTRATTELTVGHRLTGDLVGHGNRDLLSPTLPSGAPNPYYNGGSEEAQPDFSHMSTADADKAYEALPSGSVFTDTDGKRKKKP